MTGERITIEGEQTRSLMREGSLGRSWYTPIAEVLVRQALEGKRDAKIFVVGCGPEAKDARTYAKLTNVGKILGIDVNLRALWIARDLTAEEKGKERVLELEFADITHPDVTDLFEGGSFDVVTFIGVFTNIIKNAQGAQALKNSAQLLKPEAHVVISDYELQQDVDYWHWRYKRDEQLLESLGFEEDLYGTIIVRPGGFRGEEADRLSFQELTHLWGGMAYERLARHRQKEVFLDLLHEAGFRLERMKQSLVTDRDREALLKEGRLHPRDVLSNIQILARKTA